MKPRMYLVPAMLNILAETNAALRDAIEVVEGEPMPPPSTDDLVPPSYRDDGSSRPTKPRRARDPYKRHRRV